jgi:hypothetical protein
MPEVNVQHVMRLPPVPALSAVKEVLAGIASDDGAWRDFPLHVDLRDIGLPDLGYIAVPVRVKVGEPRDDVPNALPVHIEAKRNPEAFPVFEGNVGVDGSGPSSSTMWLAGTYETPHNPVAAFIDAALMGKVADLTLRNFVADLADAAQREGERSEIAAVHYRLFDRS